MQVVITIEGSQADVFEQEPDELVQFSTDGEYTCVDGCGVLTYPESGLTVDHVLQEAGQLVLPR